ncbi:MAG: hypothetical protein M3O09_04485, partial [Acidobacteriota bacterium]|nr:hypothetical protein [Acidobacteriota bacterium]
MPETATQSQATKDFLALARKRFQLAADAEADTRKLCLEDLKFSVGDQWPEEIKIGRGRKVTLTMDQIQQSINQVSNEYRQQRPATNVAPVGNDSDEDTAEIFQGAIRHIEVRSDAEIAYDNAHDHTVRTGFGSYRFLTEYTDNDGNQEILIAPIRNQFGVYWQPGVSQDKATWCFLISDIPVEEYDDALDTDNTDAGRMNSKSLVEFSSEGDAQQEWITKEYIRVAEYFTVEEIAEKGKKTKRKVTWHKINAVEELEKPRNLPGSSIPIFTCTGYDIEVDGKRYLAGLVRNVKDAQRQYNYMVSAATEAIALAPKAPFIMADGQAEGYEKMWENANTDTYSTLFYKPFAVNGTPLPPPQRQQSEPPIQAMTVMINQARMDLRASTGLYDPSLGQNKGDESGKAIQSLQKQGDVATLNYSDNMARTMRRAGNVLIDWIRHYYDAPRIQRIIKPDGSVSQVVIHNGADQADQAQALLTDKIKKIYDIGVGDYDIVIDVGPNFKTKREQAVSSQLEFLKLLPPQVAVNYTDLVAGNMDWPQAKEFAARAKKMLPPQLQDQDDGDPEAKLQQMQQVNAHLAQQHQLLEKA